EVAVLGLGRHLEALAGDVVLPAVVGAAEAAFLDPAEPERDAAVRAELVDEAAPALAVAEGDQALGGDLHAHRRAVVLRQLRYVERGQPGVAKEFAGRRAGGGLRRELVDLRLRPACTGLSHTFARLPPTVVL